MLHLKCNVGEYGIILNGAGEFLALKLPINDEFPKESWMFPGGRLDESDQPMEGLRREIREETSLSADVVAPLFTARWGIEEPQKYTVFYLCRVPGNETVALSSEHTEARWLPFAEASALPWLNEYYPQALEKAQKYLRKRE